MTSNSTLSTAPAPSAPGDSNVPPTFVVVVMQFRVGFARRADTARPDRDRSIPLAGSIYPVNPVYIHNVEPIAVSAEGTGPFSEFRDEGSWHYANLDRGAPGHCDGTQEMAEIAQERAGTAVGLAHEISPLNEFGAIARLVLRHPKDAYGSQAALEVNWRDQEFSPAPHFDEAVEEFERFVQVLESANIEIDYLPSDERAGMSAIYSRDSSIVTRGGAILCNMRNAYRAKEPAAAARSTTRLRTNHLSCPDKPSGALYSPGPAQKLRWREGPQTAANRTSGSNPTRFFCDIKDLLAAGVGFEPTIRLIAVYALSRRAPSTTRPPLRVTA